MIAITSTPPLIKWMNDIHFAIATAKASGVTPEMATELVAAFFEPIRQRSLWLPNETPEDYALHVLVKEVDIDRYIAYNTKRYEWLRDRGVLTVPEHRDWLYQKRDAVKWAKYLDKLLTGMPGIAELPAEEQIRFREIKVTWLWERLYGEMYGLDEHYREQVAYERGQGDEPNLADF